MPERNKIMDYARLLQFATEDAQNLKEILEPECGSPILNAPPTKYKKMRGRSNSKQGQVAKRRSKNKNKKTHRK